MKPLRINKNNLKKLFDVKFYNRVKKLNNGIFIEKLQHITNKECYLWCKGYGRCNWRTF